VLTIARQMGRHARVAREGRHRLGLPDRVPAPHYFSLRDPAVRAAAGPIARWRAFFRTGRHRGDVLLRGGLRPRTVRAILASL